MRTCRSGSSQNLGSDLGGSQGWERLHEEYHVKEYRPLEACCGRRRRKRCNHCQARVCNVILVENVLCWVTANHGEQKREKHARLVVRSMCESHVTGENRRLHTLQLGRMEQEHAVFPACGAPDGECRCLNWWISGSAVLFHLTFWPFGIPLVFSVFSHRVTVLPFLGPLFTEGDLV